MLDINTLTEEFFGKSRWWKPVTPMNVIVQVDPETLALFQSQGEDYEKKWLRHYAFMQRLTRCKDVL
ncbi:hypothetical protein [Nostoc sp.]|uniref:hypothetical protein n=1 Tax=Nostoc sp. TaxID=1180 RepID=UPI002FFB5647